MAVGPAGLRGPRAQELVGQDTAPALILLPRMGDNSALETALKHLTVMTKICFT